MRHDALLNGAPPCRQVGRELQPGCAQFHVIIRRNASKAIHTVSDTLGNAAIREARHGCPRHAGSFCLPTSKQPGLLLGEVSYGFDGRGMSHSCIV